ncbi:MAG TPA: NUDIX hydrolase [Nevskiales bacterium]|nr:NUDIX hydrolase [Nevskiales bacterium]
MGDNIWRPHVTVAAVAERDGRFLLVEERIDGRLLYNQPAGHLDENESLIAAVAREAREETAWDFEPEALIGLYLWKEPTGGKTFLRAAFAGHCLRHHPQQPLDAGIQRALWLSRDEIAALGGRLRSPLVLRCVDDYLRGCRYPLDVLQHLAATPDHRGS